MKKTKWKKKKVWRYYSKCCVKILAVGLVFPLIIGVIYALPFPQVIAVTSGELLSFYGTFLGIFASFVTYRKEIEHKEKERKRDIKPAFYIELKKSEGGAKEYRLMIHNVSTSIISNVFLYDVYWKDVMKKDKDEINIGFYKTVEDKKDGTAELKFNSDIKLDKQGYPEEIYFTCEDVDGNYWMCSFNKVEVDGEKRYFPEDFFVL